MLSIAYMMNHEVYRSIQCLKDILKIEPDNEDARRILIEYYTDASEDALLDENYKRALIILREGLDACPESVELQASMGAVYLDMDDKAKAEELFRSAINMESDDHRSYLTVARHYISRDMLTEAEEYFKQAMDIDPRNYRVYIDIATEYLKSDLVGKAQEYLEMAEKLRPNDITLIEEIIRCMMKEELYEHAVSYADRLLKMKPISAKHFLIAAGVYHDAKDNKTAIDLLEKGKKIAQKTNDSEILDKMNILEAHIRFGAIFDRLMEPDMYIDDFIDFEEDGEESN